MAEEVTPEEDTLMTVIKDANRGFWAFANSMAQASGTNVLAAWMTAMLTAYGLQNFRLLTPDQAQWITWGATGLVGANVAQEFLEFLPFGGGSQEALLPESVNVTYSGPGIESDVEARRAIGELQQQMAALLSGERKAKELLQP